MNGDWSLLRLMKTEQARETSDTSQARFEAIEIIEALILALVAVATAWSGYQAAQWAGKRAEIRRSDRLRVTAEGLATLAGQERIYDSDTFNSWLAAKLNRQGEAAEFFERRFRERITAPHSQPGWAPIPSRTRKRLRARSSCPSITTPNTSSSLV